MNQSVFYTDMSFKCSHICLIKQNTENFQIQYQIAQALVMKQLGGSRDKDDYLGQLQTYQLRILRTNKCQEINIW